MSTNIPFLTGRELDEILMRKNIRIYFIGILGSGMLPLAKLAQSLGFSVLGSDSKLSHREIIDGIDVSGHDADRIDGADVAVISFAIHDDNPEIIRAGELMIPITTRAELLGRLMLSYRMRIGVSGSHGKSTTTAIIDKVLCDCGYTPTTVPGAKLYDGRDCRFGSKDFFVYEGCEYRDAFLKFFPSVQVITGIELDHTDYFSDIDALTESFYKCANLAEKRVVLNLDFAASDKFKAALDREVVTYGKREDADYRYVIKERTPEACRFFVFKRGKKLLEVATHLMGEYNVSNMTAAVAVLDSLGIDADMMSRSLCDFPGIERRMSRIGSLCGVDLFYDYAHHPTEIALAIGALKERYGKCTVIFRPHTYTRTKSLWQEFVSSLGLADRVFLLDVYPAREAPIEGINSENLAKALGDRCTYCNTEAITDLICDEAVGAIVIMGAGEVDSLVSELNKRCKTKEI